MITARQMAYLCFGEVAVNLLLLRLAVMLLGIGTLWSFQINDLNPIDLAKANEFTHHVTTSEWLGPLAPIAISPFFGIACLAGMSQISDGTFLENNQFISSNPVLQNPYVFWAFLILTLITSVPRLTKVSKPIAQALDQIETYSGIITLLIIRAAVTFTFEREAESAAIIHMGLFAITFEMLACVFAVLNIIVINTVKFFFEILAWLTPAPSVDALLEATNKAVCACLMSIYAHSPFAASAISVLLFIACLMVFKWIHRRVIYARHIFFDPILSFLLPAYGKLDQPKIQVFNQQKMGPFAAKSKLYLETTAEGWCLTQQRFFTPPKSILVDRSTRVTVTLGLLTNRITIPGETYGDLLFTRRYADQMEAVVEQLNLLPKETATGEGWLGIDSL